jgi:hypothetical protein
LEASHLTGNGAGRERSEELRCAARCEPLYISVRTNGTVLLLLRWGGSLN